ncbi:MBL fold metallo-hydrolase [Cellulosilyticum sp. ST5]
MDKKLQPSVPLADKEFALGNGTFKFYNQKAQYDDVNDNSLVALYVNGSNKFLFTGDSGKEVEAKLPLKDIGTIDVLKVGHHGSKSLSSDAFIKAIAPKYAVICCGKDNKYGHPHKETTTTLSKYKVTTYRTDISGTIIVTSDGKKITVTTENKTTEKAGSSATNNSATINTTVKKQETSTTQPITTTVYITKTGEKYHKDGCSSLSKSKIAISLEDAKGKGYGPCSKCCK